MHDDQHGTAIVVTAGLLNAAKVVKKKFEDLKVVVIGAGAAGRAVTLLLKQAGIANIIVTDSKGIIYKGRTGLEGYKRDLALGTNPEGRQGDVMAAVTGADVIIGVSGPGTIAMAHIEAMATDPIVFALANPIPEIMPEDAKRAGATVIATGRSDFPNQINNSLAFPGLFRGALDKGVRDITDEMKLAAAKKIAGLIKKPTADSIIPPVMTPGLVKTVASAVKK
jgi:malate dehydrogenase (oxaloacetate-decarboxylating)